MVSIQYIYLANWLYISINLLCCCHPCDINHTTTGAGGGAPELQGGDARDHAGPEQHGTGAIVFEVECQQWEASRKGFLICKVLVFVKMYMYMKCLVYYAASYTGNKC
jgi:hypothetical protein